MKPVEPAAAWRDIFARPHVGNVVLVSLGVWLHAADSLVVSTLLPSVLRDIGGVEYAAWTFALYEIGTIVAGAAGALVAARLGIRRAMGFAAVLYAAGCMVSAVAPAMPAMLIGRTLQGLGGGSLMALSFIAVARLFPARLMPRVMGAISALWGVSAFAGPLIGGVFAEINWWQGAFWFFCAQAMLLAVWLFARSGGDRREAPAPASRFPGLRLATVAGAVIAISAAGIGVEPWRSGLLIALGVALLAAFVHLDSSAASRLMPPRPLSPFSTLGPPLVMALAFAIATTAIGAYGPLLMGELHGASALTAGYVVALASIGWSTAAILVSGADARHDRPLIAAGMILLTLSVGGFMLAMPSGPFWVLPALALMEGAGFGMAWTFILRRALMLAPEGERDRFSSALPTIHRLGYALGAAMTGIVANAAGFASGVTPEAARAVGFWVFAAGLPFAAIGLFATARFLRAR